MSYRFLPAILVVAACGGSNPKPAQPETSLAWKDMNHEQRGAYMKKVVMPRMKEVWTAFDPQYADMDCKTCHGPGADDHSFTMPNPDIRPLPDSEERFKALFASDEDVAKFTPFMGQQVVPEMARLLQLTPFDPATMSGDFSCSSCHQLVGEDGKAYTDPRMLKAHDDHDHAD